VAFTERKNTAFFLGAKEQRYKAVEVYHAEEQRITEVASHRKSPNFVDPRVRSFIPHGFVILRDEGSQK